MLAEIFGPDLLIVAIVLVVLLFGGAAIPKLARNLGSAKNQFEKGMEEGKAERRRSQRHRRPPAPHRRRTRQRRPEEKSPGVPDRGEPRGVTDAAGHSRARRPWPTDVLSVADRLWNGELSTSTFHPVDHMGGFVEITDGVGFCPSFANVSAFATEDGLVLVDTGSAPLAQIVHDDIRTWSPDRLNTAVYSHGHIDHVFGVPVWEEEAAAQGWAAPEVIAHERCRPASTATSSPRGTTRSSTGASSASPTWTGPPSTATPTAPTTTRLDVSVGGVDFALRHEKGETDDHTMTWQPGHPGAVLRRPVHLGLAQRGQPPEGAALPARVGRGPAAHARARRRVPPARARVPRRRRRARPPGPHRHRGPPRLPGRPDARRDERGRTARRRHPHACGPPRRSRSGRTSSPSTTSPSSSCTPSGASTAGGGTATPPP